MPAPAAPSMTTSARSRSARRPPRVGLGQAHRPFSASDRGELASAAGCALRTASRPTRSASTARTPCDVSARMCSGTPGLVSQRDTSGEGAGGEVFGQLKTHRRVGDDPAAGQELFDLAADVGCVPRRPSRNRGARLPRPPPPRGGPARAGVASCTVGQCLDSRARPVAQPAAMHLSAWFGDYLVRPCVSPCSGVPCAPLSGPGCSPGCAVRHSVSYRSMLARSAPRVGRRARPSWRLFDLPPAFTLAMRGQRGAKLRVATRRRARCR